MHIWSLADANLQQPSIVTIGVFDGVHRGHQFLVEQLVAAAHATQRAAVVLTFYPHPDMVIGGVEGRYYLTTPEKRAEILLNLGVDLVVTHPFDDHIRHIRAADFVDRLLQYLNMSALWATADFAMGYQREGNIDFLRQQGLEKGFDVKTVELVMSDENGDRISSAEIRKALAAGNVQRAMKFLGKPFTLSGEVVHGEKRGRKIGFPTANIAIWKEHMLPQNGVYACYAHLGDETFQAVTNVGRRPTFDGQFITIESHLLDFDRDIYGQTLHIDFIDHLRPEMKFSGIGELVAQIKQDVQISRERLNSGHLPTLLN